MNYTKISELPAITTVSDPTTAVLPIVDAGTTYKVAVDDLAISRSTEATVWTQLRGAVAVSGIMGPLAIGDNDLYTVPSSKSAIIGAGVLSNDSGGSVTVFPELKHSGTYYRIGNNSTASTGTSNSITLAANLVMNSGDILAMNAATTAGAYCVFTIVEFLSSSALKGAFIFGAATGDNTLYTCPIGKTALPVATSAAINFAGKPTFTFGTNGSAPGTTQLRLVKSGGSPSLLINSQLISGGTVISVALLGGFTMTAGDSAIMNVTTGGADEIISGAFLELND